MRLKKSIECWIYNTTTNRFLLLHCPATLNHRPYWQPVSGGVEKGETAIQSCLREIFEETGMTFDEGDVTRLIDDMQVPIPQNDMELSKNVFIIQTQKEKVTISNEHDDCAWTSPEDVPAMLLWDSNKSTFQEVLKFLEIA